MIDPIEGACRRWEESLRAGQELTPAELLPDQPELHAPLRAAIDNLRGASQQDIQKGNRWPFQLTLLWLSIVVGPPLVIAGLIASSAKVASPPPVMAGPPPHKIVCGDIPQGGLNLKPIHGVAFHPDGKTFVAVGESGYIGVWDAAAIRERKQWFAGGQEPVLAVAFSHDGQVLACGNKVGKVRVYDTDGDLTQLFRFRTAIRSLSFARAGPLLILADEGATLIDLATDMEIGTCPPPDPSTCCGGISPDGKWIVTAGIDKLVRVWDAATGKERNRLEGHKGTVLALAISPDGSRVASLSTDRTVRVWDLATGKKLCTVADHLDQVSAVCFTSDGSQIASGDCTGVIQIFDSCTGRKVTAFVGEVGGVNALCFSPNGQDLIYGGEKGFRRYQMK
jgi:WD40 repeat protein